MTDLILRAHSLPNGEFSCLHLLGCVSLMKSCLQLFLSVTFAAAVSALCLKTLQKRWLVPRLWPFPYQESLPKSPDHPSMWHLTPVSKRAERVAENTTSREERYKMAKGLDMFFFVFAVSQFCIHFKRGRDFFISCSVSLGVPDSWYRPGYVCNNIGTAIPSKGTDVAIPINQPINIYLYAAKSHQKTSESASYQQQCCKRMQFKLNFELTSHAHFYYDQEKYLYSRSV